MRYLGVEQVIRLHQRIVDATGGSSGIRDEGALISAIKMHIPHLKETISIPLCSIKLLPHAFV
jgi:death on curing protein